MQIPILSGIYTNAAADLRASYPVNLVPTVADSGINQGYLRPADGIAAFGVGPGIDRGGIRWNSICYRVMGSKLVSVASDGTTTTLGDVGAGGQVRFDYSFDRLAINSGANLYYWDGAALTQVTDADLGTVLDVVWVDGYFMTTDGANLVVTELTNPLQVNPLKYGSSEADPDPVKCLLQIHNEVYALNRHTIEVFDNVGGDLFPFQRIEGAQIQKGTLGGRCSCVYMGSTIAFLGSGRNESPAIYLAESGRASKISSEEIDIILKGYSEAALSYTTMEAMVDKGRNLLHLHLPDKTIVFDSEASKILGKHVWFILSSGLIGSRYRAFNFVWCYDRWLCGDPLSTNHGYLTDTIGTHYGAKVRWEFGTQIVYNEGRGVIFHELELVALTGRVAFGADPWISTEYSSDGVIWSQPKSIRAGQSGERNKRLVWFQQGAMRHWRAQRFRGDSDSFVSFVRLEAKIEGLNF